ncbi:hypothetical protein VTN31DRAFT_378 [Thermomyces dupontii]|uniref:uncharacterized protein n=1 Tax=Talaromyces thermophilus TaxID=28565 RepID=UPI0037431294
MNDIIIIGAGLTGLCSALTLSYHLSTLNPKLRITVFERHAVPSTSGGAISLGPVALRYLDRLGVLNELDRFGPEAGVEVDAIEIFSTRTGKELGEVDFTGKHGIGYSGDYNKRYKGRRVLRINLTLAMIAAAEKTGNVRIVFGKKLVGRKHTTNPDRIAVRFEDGTTAEADLLLGCDGVNSLTRTKIVDPGYTAQYSGFSLVQSTIPTSKLKTSVHFRTTSLNISRHGSFLMSFFDKQREELFLSAMVECREEAVQDHRVESYAQGDSRRQTLISESLRREVFERFGDSAIPCIREVAAATDIDWLLYPIHEVPPGGRWHIDRALLLGDAAHAMLPRDESVTYALDDAILFSRILAQYLDYPLQTAFDIYESLRRHDVNAAFRASRKLWDARYRDAGVIESRFKEWLLPLRLKQSRSDRDAAFEFDAEKIEIPTPQDSRSCSSGSLDEKKFLFY